MGTCIADFSAMSPSGGWCYSCSGEEQWAVSFWQWAVRRVGRWAGLREGVAPPPFCQCVSDCLWVHFSPPSQTSLDPIWTIISHFFLPLFPFCCLFSLFHFCQRSCYEGLCLVVCFGQLFCHCAVVFFDCWNSVTVLQFTSFSFSPQIFIGQFLIFFNFFPHSFPSNSSCNTPLVFKYNMIKTVVTAVPAKYQTKHNFFSFSRCNTVKNSLNQHQPTHTSLCFPDATQSITLLSQKTTKQISNTKVLEYTKVLEIWREKSLLTN